MHDYVALTVKCPSADVDTQTVHLPHNSTIRDLKAHIQATWPGKPRTDGIRCISAGRVLDDGAAVDSLGIVHIVVRPDAWTAERSSDVPPGEASSSSAAPEQAAPEPAENGDSTADQARAAGPQPDIAPNNPLLAYVEDLNTTELDLFILALAATYESYVAYARQLGRIFPPLPIERPQGLTEVLASSDAASRAIRLVESDVMHWTPLEHESAAARRYASNRVAYKYTEVTYKGLPYLLREPVADQSAARALEKVIDARLLFLTRVLYSTIHLRGLHTLRAELQTAPPSTERRTPPRIALQLRDNAGRILPPLLFFALYTFVPLAYITWDMPWRMRLSVSVFPVLFFLVQVYFMMRRVLPQPAAQAPPRPPAPQTAGMQAPLELPRLPRLPRHPRNLRPTYWAHRLALYGLEREEAEIGFEHVDSTSDTLAISWTARDWQGEEHEHVPPPAKFHERVLTMVVVFLISFVPLLEEWRSDAISLRNDAILALSRRWETLQASSMPHSGTPPRILRHSYSLRLISQHRSAT